MKGDFSRLSFRPEKHTAGVLHQQGRVWLDADWNEEVQTRLDLAQREALDVIGRCGVPKPGTAFALSANPKVPGDFFISSGEGPLGRCYVDGILCKLYDPSNTQISYLNQPDYIDPPAIAMPQTTDDTVDALVYIETWRRLVTYLEDPEIREKALNGPDTATRLRTVVQVKVLALTTPVTSCDDAMQRVTDGDSTLTTLPPVDEQPPDPCRIPDPGSYTGRENHLYRVEIHDHGGVGSPLPSPARFKWSKNNAADAVQVLSVSQDRLTVTVQSLGRDLATALVDGNIVEICDDRSELGPARGHLTTIAGNPDPDLLTITLADPLPPEFVLPSNRHATLRRWDGVGDVARAFDQQTTPDMDLGDGVHIQFGGTELRPGDYWQFVARSVDGSVERLTNARPAGIVRHRCALALVRWQNLQLFEVAALVKAARARALAFDLVDAIEQHFQATQVPRTDSASLQEVARAAGATDNELIALFQLADGLQAPNELTFRVVQDCRSPFVPLIDEDDTDKAMHVVRVVRFDVKNNVVPLRNNSIVAADDILGIGVWFDRPVKPHTIARPTCYVEVEVPFRTLTTDVGTAGVPTTAPQAYQRVTVAAKLDAINNQLKWSPLGLQQLNDLALLAPREDDGLLARLHLRGNVIYSLGAETLFLDGDAFGVPSEAEMALRFPTGDGKRGGDFEMWFWLKPKAPPLLGLYVADGVTRSIEFYQLFADGPAAPQRTAAMTIAGAEPVFAVGVAVDAAGNIYAIYRQPSLQNVGFVAQFAAGAHGVSVPAAISPLIPGGREGPTCVALDGSANVYVTDSTMNPAGAPVGSVLMFTAGALAQGPSRTITGPATSLARPLGIVVGPDGTVYVANNNAGNSGGTLLAFDRNASGNVKFARSFSDSLGRWEVRGVALDGAGRLYVTAHSPAPGQFPDSVFIFSSSSGASVGTISGPRTLLGSPYGIAVDPDGNVHVANQDTRTVTVYRPGQFGDVDPIHTITTAGQALTNPFHLAIGL